MPEAPLLARTWEKLVRHDDGDDDRGPAVGMDRDVVA